MPTQLFANNATSALAGAITAAATSLSVQAGQGAKFPTPTGGDFFLLTLFQIVAGVETNYEIVKVTARSVDTLTIVRAQEGTTARAFGVGDQVSLRATAGSLSAMGPTALAAATALINSFGLGNVDAAPLITDLDDVTVSAGLYYANGSTVGTHPIAGPGFVLHKVYGAAGFQLMQVYGQTHLYYRSRSSSVWGAWVELADRAYADFAASSAASGRLSLTGGSLTGNLFMTATAPAIHLLESDQTGAAGKWRFVADGAQLRIDRSTDTAANGYATSVADFYISATGLVSVPQLSVGTSALVPNAAAKDNSFNAANTRYVDAAVGTALPLAGGTLTGKLGVGGAPTYQLDVVGTGLTGTATASNTVANISSTAAGYDANIRFSDGTNAAARIGYLAGAVYFYVNGAERGRFDTSGNFMVGRTAALTATTDIATFERNANDNTRVVINNQSTGAAATAMLDLEAFGAAWRMYVPSSTNNQNPLVWTTTGASTGEKMRLDYAGRLLLGVTGDDGSGAKLQVGGVVRAAQSVFASAGLNGEVSIGADSAGSIEIGKAGRTAAGTPYIDFNSSAGGSDYDVRIVADGGSATSGQGNLNVAAATLKVNGNVVQTVNQKDAADGYAGLTGFALNLKNAAGAILSKLVSAATAARTYTFPDKDGTVAMLSDIPTGSASVVAVVASYTVSGSPTYIDFATLFTSDYDEYWIQLLGAAPTTGSNVLALRMFNGAVADSNALYSSIGGDTQQHALLGQYGLTGVMSTECSMLIKITGTTSTLSKLITAFGYYYNAGYMSINRTGGYFSTNIPAGFRLYWTGGSTWYRGTVRVYGVKKA